MSTPHDPYGNGSQDPYGSGAPDSGYGQQPDYGQAAGYGQQPDYGQAPGQDAYGSPQYGAPDQHVVPAYGSGPAGGAPQYGDAGPQYGSAPGDYGAQAPSYGDQFTSAVPSGQAPYQDPYGGAPMYTADPAHGGGSGEKNIWGILALIAGILAVLGSFGSLVPFVGIAIAVVVFIVAVLAVIFGFVGISAAGKGRATNKGLSITGVIMGFLAIVLAIILTVVSTLWGMRMVSSIPDPDAGWTPSAVPTDPGSPSSPDAPGTESSDAEGDGDPSADPTEDAGTEQGGGSDAPAGSSLELRDGVAMSITVREGQASSTAAGAEATGGEIAAVTVTIENTSGTDFDPAFPLIECTYSGGMCDSVFDVMNGHSGSLNFEVVPAGSTVDTELAFAVPHADIESMQLEFFFSESDRGYGSPYVFTIG